MSSQRIPCEIADQLVTLLFDEGHLLKFDQILYPACRSPDLIAAVKRYCEREDKALPDGVALTTNAETADTLRCRFDDMPLDVIEASFLAEGDRITDTFDYVLCDPPSITWNELSEERRREYAASLSHVTPEDTDIHSESLYMERALQFLRSDGRGVFRTDTALKSETAGSTPRDRLAPLINDLVPVSITDGAGGEQSSMIAVITGEGEGEYDPDARTQRPDPETVEAQLSGAADKFIDQRTVKSIMTPRAEIDAYAADQDASAVYFDMFYQDYDATLVFDDPKAWKGLHGYVSRAELTVQGGESIGSHARPIPEERCVAPEATIDILIPVLGQHRFCFIGDTDKTTGLITRYDLNKLPVYHHLFDQFARFEIGLRQLIRRHAPNWESKTSVTVGIYGTTELVPDTLATAQLGDLIKIAQDVDLPKTLDPDIDAYDATLNDLVELRNAIAHYNPIVHVMSSRPTSDHPERGAPQLAAEYNLLTTCLRSLKTSLSTP